MAFEQLVFLLYVCIYVGMYVSVMFKLSILGMVGKHSFYHYITYLVTKFLIMNFVKSKDTAFLIKTSVFIGISCTYKIYVYLKTV